MVTFCISAKNAFKHYTIFVCIVQEKKQNFQKILEILFSAFFCLQFVGTGLILFLTEKTKREHTGMKQKTATISILAAGTLWGTMGIFVRHFNAWGIGSMEIGTLRILMGLLITGIYLVASGRRELLRVRFRDLWCFAGTGIGSLFFMNLTYFTAMQYTSLAVAGVLLYTAPIFVMLLSAALFRERITGRKLLALGLAFCGCVLVSGLGSDSRVSLTGLLLGLGAGVSYAMYSIFGRFAIRRGYGSWTMTFYSFFFCGLLSLFFCNWQAVRPVAAQPVQLLWVLALGFVTAFAPYVLYSRGLEHVENSRASILASMEPVVATVLSIVVYAEPMSLPAGCGVALVLGAIILLSVQKTGSTA